MIDVHTQIGADDWLTRNEPSIDGTTRWRHQADYEDLLRDCEQLAGAGLELRVAVAFPFPSAPNHDYREGNDLIAAVADRTVDRAVAVKPLYAIDPFDDSARDWLEFLLDRGGCCSGIKLNPFLGRPGGYGLLALADDDALVELISKHGLVVAMHVGTGREHVTRPAFPNSAADPMSAIELARRLPHVPMLMLHVLRLLPETLAAATELPNVFVDLSGLSSIGQIQEAGHPVLFAEEPNPELSGPADAIDWILSEFGLEDQLVFGSASPFCTWWGSSPVADAVSVLAAGLSSSVQDKLLWANAGRMLGLGAEGHD